MPLYVLMLYFDIDIAKQNGIGNLNNQVFHCSNGTVQINLPSVIVLFTWQKVS